LFGRGEETRTPACSSTTRSSSPSPRTSFRGSRPWRRREPRRRGSTAAQIGGDWALAAELWAEIGCPDETPLALADGDDEDAVRRALDEFRRLGALPAAAMVARRLG
jgi:hypothetical protein